MYQIPLENKKIIILGSGGTAKTVAYVAKKRKCKSIAFVSREKKENGWTYEDLKQLQDLKVKYLGKKGELTGLLRGMGSLSLEERPKMGALVNSAKQEIENEIQEKEN